MSGDKLSSLVPSAQGSNRPNEFVFDGKIRCVIMNGEPHWSIFDAYRVYGSSGNPRSDWARDTKDLEEQGFDIVSNVRLYQFFNANANKRTRATPVANHLTFMRIAQVAKFKEWEPLRQKMAALMADNVRRSIVKDADWHAAHQSEMVSHERLMDALEEAVWYILSGWHVEKATDAVFKGLYKRSREQIKERIGLKRWDLLEQYQSTYALGYQSIAKQLAAERLDERSELDFDEAKAIIHEAVSIIAPQVKALSEVLGRDIATNLPLLTSGAVEAGLVDEEESEEAEPNFPKVARYPDEYPDPGL
jgi:hypothetical protein